jgi:hypothetical protein
MVHVLSAALAALALGQAPTSGSAAPAARAEAAARAVAAPGATATLRREEALGSARAFRFERRIEGLPVFGGDAVALVDRAGAATLVRAESLPRATGSFRLGDVEAAGLAVARLGTGARLLSQPRAEPGWALVAGSLRPAFRVDLAASSPAGDWRVLVDADSGVVLLAHDRRRSSHAWVYEVSPAEDLSGPCPLETAGGARTACKGTVDVVLDGLDAANALVGPRVIEVAGCGGLDSPAMSDAAPPPGSPTCAPTALPDASGDWRPLPAEGRVDDAFAEVEAFRQVNLSADWFARLAPSAPPPDPVRVYVNAMQGGAPYANAFFSPGTQSLTFGQGATVDFAYDGSVATHELAHAWAAALGGLDPYLDTRGLGMDPWSLDEATADALTASRLASPLIGAYAGRESGDPALRVLGGTRTCRGAGLRGTIGGISTVDGLFGEPHVDGEIYSALFWELHQGLAQVPGCGGSCDPAGEIQAAALRASAATLGVTYHSYGDALVAAAQALHPDHPEVAQFAACLVARHDLAGCDGRLVPVYAGEAKAVVAPPTVSLEIPTGLQVSVDVRVASVKLGACAGTAATGRLYLRRGLPVALAADATSATGYVIRADQTVPVTAACSGGQNTTNVTGPAVWYGLFVADAQSADWSIFQIAVGTTGVASRPPAATPKACVLQASAGGGGGHGGCGCGLPAPPGAFALAGVALAAAAPRRGRRR